MDQNHSKAYKNKGKDVDDLRRRRQEVTVELRKNKRDDALLKKRNVDQSDDDGGEETMTLGDMMKPGDLQSLVMSAMSPDATVKLGSTKMIRKMLSSDKNPPIDEIIKAGVLPVLVDSLRHSESPALQFEAAWALTNIASGTPEQTQKVVEADAVPLFIHLLSSDDESVCEQAVWALGNIIGDGPQLRDYVLQQGLLDPLLKLFEVNPSMSFMRNLTWVIVNVCRNKTPAPSMEVVSRILPVLVYLLKSMSDELIVIDAIWSVSYITDHGNDQIQMVIDSGIVNFIIPLLDSNEARIQTPSLRVIGNIATGNDLQTDVVINLGALTYVPKLLQHSKDRIRKETLWLLSNITAGNVQQIQHLITSGLVPSIIQYMDCSNFNLQREAAWAISNLTLNGTAEQVQFLFSLHVVPSICHLLGCHDVQVIEILLEAIMKLFSHFPEHPELVADEIEKCGGLDILEVLQNHENQDVYRKSFEIIEKYFSPDEEGEAMPVGDGQEFAFGGGNAGTGAGGDGGFKF